MTSKIFIGSSNVKVGLNDLLSFETPYQHIFLIHDEDGDPTTTGDQHYIEAGPYGSSFTGNLVVQVDDTISGTDHLELDNSNPPDGDVDDPGDKNPYTDFNYTTLDIGAANADDLWDDFTAFANSLGSLTNGLRDTGISYPFAGSSINSTSVINSILSASGIDLRENFPEIGGDTGSHNVLSDSWYMGHDHIIDGTGNDTFTVYSGMNGVFHDNTGDDTIRIEEGATVIITNDGDGNSDNTIVLVDIDPADVALSRIAEGLVIKNSITGHVYAVIGEHFGSNGESVVKLQFEDTGVIDTDDDIDLTTLTSADLVDITDTLAGWFDSIKDFVGNLVPTVWDPLVIDLDGDGIETVSLANGTHFDLDDDGFAEKTGWVGSDDGLLVYDENDNDQIDDGSELFGDETTDGFTALSAHDSNGNGKIESGDTIWSDLKVWKDENGNGYAESDELHSMGDLNIQSISLNATETETATAGGTITHTATLTYTNQTTTTVANIAFDRDMADTHYVDDYTLDISALGLPNLHGYATMPEFRIALSLDNDTEDSDSLMSLMQSIASMSFTEIFDNYSTVKDTIADVLYRWAGVDDVSPSSRGSFIDARQLEFLETYTGELFFDENVANTSPGLVQANLLIAQFEEVLNRVTGNMLIQTIAQALFEDGLEYNLQTDVISGTLSISQDALDVLEDYATNTLATTAERKDFWLGVADLIHSVSVSKGASVDFDLTSGDETALDTAIENSDAALTWYSEDHNPGGGVTSIEYRTINPLGSIITGDGTGETLNGSNDDDIISGGGGADTINGYSGGDILYGHNESGAGDDNAADILWGNDGNDRLDGGGGDDIVIGGADEDHIIGGAGNDILIENQEQGAEQNLMEGGTGNDDYRIGPRFLTGAPSGNTTIFINDTSGTDTLRFGTSTKSVATITTADEVHFTLADLTFTRVLDNSIQIEGVRNASGSNYDTFKVLLTDQLTDLNNSSGAGIEYIELYDGHGGGANRVTLDLKDYLNNFTGSLDAIGTNFDDVIHGSAFGDGDDNISGLSGNDIIYGDDGDDIINGGGGNDIIYGGTGNDTLTAGGANNEFYGEDGNDTITGSGIMSGGSGNDTLTGSASTDETFIYTSGSDTYSESGGFNVIILPTNILPEDVSFANTGSVDVTMTVGGLGSILALNQRNGVVGTSDHLDQIIYADGFVQYFEDYANSWLFDTNQSPASDETITVGATVTNHTVIGRGGTDRINGHTTESDSLSGGADNDFLYGKGGDDYLHGGSGDDLLEGGAGDDLMIGGTGTDTADYSNETAGTTVNLATGTATDGNSDTDTLVSIENVTGSDYADTITGDDSANVLDGGAGNDTLDGGTGDDTLIGGAGNDTLTGGDGTDTADYSAAAGAVTVNLGSGSASNDGDSGSDTLSGIENVIGSANADTITGDTGANVLNGGAGADNIDGGSGNDVLIGGAGTDSLTGGNGTDTVDYSNAAGAVTVDLLSGTASNDGDGGSDTLATIENVTGSAYADTITGSTAANVLSGGAGNDNIDGGSGNDTLIGGAGNDTLTGNTGTDTVDYSAAAAGVTVNLSTGSASNDGDGGSDTLSGIENIIGSANADNITGDTGANELHGGAGNDTIDGGSGNDIISGGLGDDTLDGGSGSSDYVSYENSLTAVNINFSTGSATGEGTDSLTGFERAIGSAYNDTFTGNTSANRFEGGAGDDTAYGGGGNDTINGEDGNDTLYGDDGRDNISGGEGDDIIYGGAGDDSIGFNALSGGSGNDIIYGGDGDDKLEGGADSDILYGGDGLDRLEGGDTGGGHGVNIFVFEAASAFNDVDYIVDFNANQIVSGGGVDISDLLSAYNPLTDDIADFVNIHESGSDSYIAVDADGGGDGFVDVVELEGITGLNGIDTLVTKGLLILDQKNYIFGTDANETINGTANDDYIYTSFGLNTVYAGAGNDFVHAGNSVDTLYGEDGNDILWGYTGADNIYGGAGDDKLYGQDNVDHLYGGDGDDYLEGGSLGGDYFYGGNGADTMTGGTFDDYFIFEADSVFDAVDTITNFNTTYDVIDISDVLDGFYTDGVDDITDFVTFTENSGDTEVYIDLDGDGGSYSAVQAILLEGVTGLDVATLEGNGHLIASI